MTSVSRQLVPLVFLTAVLDAFARLSPRPLSLRFSFEDAAKREKVGYENLQCWSLRVRASFAGGFRALLQSNG